MLLQLLLLLVLDQPKPRVVANDLKPKRPLQLVLTRELDLGPTNLPEQLWFQGFDVSVDADRSGRMYVAESGNNRILVFAADGRFERQIGRTGEGPGEFVALRRFTLLEDGAALAFDSMQHLSRVNRFDHNLNFKGRKERQRNRFRLKDWRSGPSGQVFACELVRIDLAARKIHTRYALTDPELRERVLVSQYSEDEFDVSRVTEQGYWVHYLTAYFARKQGGQNGYFAFDSQNRIYSAQGTTYEIKRWSPDCKLELQVTRKYRPIPLDERTREGLIDEEHERVTSEIPPELHSVVTRAVVARAFAQADLPPVKPPVVGLIAMEHGFIAIHDLDLAKHRSQGDVFDEDGVFIGTYSHESTGMRNLVFKNQKAYTIERNPDGDNHLTRYGASYK